ncbi:MAG: PPC domain-containing DNA-binding protein [Candidatus Bathyarchaeia archaeon]|jgi:predicted DNA-binding protein with PD1-like motif
MKTIESREQPTLIAIGLGPGEKLLESINEAIKSNEIRDGVVISGIGTLKRCRMHYVNTMSFPAENCFYVVEEPLEIGSISGIIADYAAHLHMTVGCRDQRTYAGHLEEGCEVLYLAEVLVMKLCDMGLERRIDPQYGVSLLRERVR